MRKSFAIIAAFTLAGTGGAAFAGQPGWTLAETSGQVFISRSGQSQAVARGGRIQAGDIVSTGAAGHAVLVRGDERLEVSAHSRLRLPLTKTASGATQVFGESGAARFRAGKQPLSVKTPYLVTHVRGAAFSIAVGLDGASVKVTDGAVDVATNDGGARARVSAGETALVSASNRFRLVIDGADRRAIDSANILSREPAIAAAPGVPVAAASEPTDPVTGALSALTPVSDPVSAILAEPLAPAPVRVASRD